MSPHGDDAVLVTLQGELDLSNIGAVETQIVEQFAPPVQQVVLDLAGVTYLDSSAFAALERVRRSGPVTVVLPKTSLVHRAVMLSGLEHILTVVESIDDARA
jgi:anti-anti-sigma factor